MKGKFYTWMLLFGTVVCCLSCSKEIHGGEHMPGEEVTLSVAFEVEGMSAKTKAPTATSATPTDQEKIMTKRLLLSFKEDAFLDMKKIEDGASSATIKAKTDGVTLVGIANPDDALVNTITSMSTDNRLTYTALSSQVTAQQLTAPGMLIKSGVLKLNQVSATPPTPYKITVKQIPARVDVTIKSTGSSGESFVVSSYTVKEINTVSTLLLGSAENTATQKSGEIKGDTPTANTFSFYTYGKKAEDQKILITVTGHFTKGETPVSDEKSYKMELKPSTATGGVDSESDAVQGGYLYELTGNIKKDGLEVTLNVKPWTIRPVDVEFGGPDSDDSNVANP